MEIIKKIARKIFKYFMFPNTVLVVIIAYVSFSRMYYKEFRADIKNETLDNARVFLASQNKIAMNTDDTSHYIDLINHQLGIFKYIFCALFWYAIYNLIF